MAIGVHEQMAEALRKSELRIRELAAATVRAHEEERQWAAIEVHDRISQTLVGLIHHVQAVECMTPERSKAKPLAKRASEMLREAILESRNIMNDLYPAGLDEFGIVTLIEAALKRFQEMATCEVGFLHRNVPALDNGVATTLFRIFQGALTNVAAHSAASNVAVSLTCEGGAIDLEVEDDGAGFEPEKAVGHVGGLMSMRRRAEVIGGSFNVASSPGCGTRVTVRIPVDAVGSHTQ